MKILLRSLIFAVAALGVALFAVYIVDHMFTIVPAAC